jgi:hypothetical protein
VAGQARGTRAWKELAMACRTACSLAAVALAAAALVGASCAHPQEGAGTTTVTGGTPGRAGAIAVLSAREEAAMRLADEFCARAAACNEIRDGGRYRTEEACMADQGAKAPAHIGRLACTPTRTQAGFEECLAAVRGERCETDLTSLERLAACQSAQVCGR